MDIQKIPVSLLLAALEAGESYVKDLRVGDVFLGCMPEALRYSGLTRKQVYSTPTLNGDNARYLTYHLFIDGALEAFKHVQVYTDSDGIVTALESK